MFCVFLQKKLDDCSLKIKEMRQLLFIVENTSADLVFVSIITSINVIDKVERDA